MKKKYQIEMMSLLAGPAKTWDVGKILDVPGQCSHEEAEQLIEGKYAKIYIDPMTQKAQEADLIERQEALEAAKAEVKKQETSEAPAASESAEAPKAAPKKASDPPAPPPKK